MLPAVVNVVLSYSAAQVKYHHLQLLLEIQAPKVAYMMLGYLQQLVREPHDYTGGIGCAEWCFADSREILVLKLPQEQQNAWSTQDFEPLQGAAETQLAGLRGCLE